MFVFEFNIFLKGMIILNDGRTNSVFFWTKDIAIKTNLLL